METTATKDFRVYGLLALYDMQTGFYDSVLDGISDTDAHDRRDSKANHIAWLAGSLLEQRYELNNLFAENQLVQSGHDLFKDNQGIKEDVTYPSLEQYKREWNEISPIAREAIANATTEKLDSNFEMPGMVFPFYDMISFSMYREANMIGQIALWRRLLGYEAMKYM